MMSYPTNRVILYDRQCNPIGDLSESEILGRVRHEEINGEHTLTLTTTRILAVGMRILTIDGTGHWHEWVVDEPDEEHAAGNVPIGTYKAMWSVQYDLTTTPGGIIWAASEEGTNDPITAQEAFSMVMRDSDLWDAGTCDVTTTGGASLFDDSIWAYLGTIVEIWGGEVDATIEVDEAGVISRSVSLLSHVGDTSVKRRFDWTYDLTEIRRTPDPGPYYCRVIPRGGNEGTDSDGVKYSDRCGIDGWSKSDVRWKVIGIPSNPHVELVTIDDLWGYGYVLETTDDPATTSEFGTLQVGDVIADPYGVSWIQDNESAALFKVKMPDGRWFFPTKVVKYSLDTAGDDEELYYKALGELHDHTRPNVTYEASVIQLQQAGMDVGGLSLGDEVQCVDYGFGPDGIRVEGRVVGIEVNELDPSDTTVTIGQFQRTLADDFKVLNNDVGSVTKRVDSIEGGGTSSYVNRLIERLNAEINATGGYTYIVPGHGIVVYDRSVSDPLVGSEADSVVQIVGGSIRIANTKDPSFSGIGDWEWRTVMESGHIVADAITAVKVTSGSITDASGNTYWDLDTGVLHISSLSSIGEYEKSLGELVDNVDTALESLSYLRYANGELVLGVEGSSIQNVMTNDRQAFRMDGTDVAYFGLNDESIWELYVSTATILNMLKFGKFAWIARQNGNMTLKWIG